MGFNFFEYIRFSKTPLTIQKRWLCVGCVGCKYVESHLFVGKIYSNKIETEFSLESKNKVIDWFTSNQVSVTMSIIGLFFPDILGLIGKMERFHPRIALRWLLDKSLHFLVTSLFDISSKSVLGHSK